MAPPVKKKGRRVVKLRAVQDLFYDNQIVKEGEVYLFEGAELPPDTVAVRTDPDLPLGPQPDVASKDKTSPAWTTAGFVEKATRAAGARSVEDELLE